MEKINFNIMSFRVRSVLNNNCKKCFKVKVPLGISRETVEHHLQHETPYRIERPSREEIRTITEVFTVDDALYFVELLQFTVPYKRTIESEHLLLINGFWYDPKFRIYYSDYYDISFFNFHKDDAKEYCNNLINVPSCTICRTGNWKAPGQYKLLQEEKLGMKVWNLYRIIHCTETTIENQILDK